MGCGKGGHPQFFENLGIIRVVGQGDGPGYTELNGGQLADDQVVLVVGCDGQHHVGIHGTGLLEDGGIAAVAADHHRGKLPGQLSAFLPVPVDDHNLVSLGGEAPAQKIERLAGAHDQHLHDFGFPSLARPLATASRNISAATDVGQMVSMPSCL